KLERGAHALDPAAAMHGDQCRRRFRAFRQIQVALQLDAVVIGVGDAKVSNVIRGHCWGPFCRARLWRPIRHAMSIGRSCRPRKASLPDRPPRAMVKYISRARTM